MKVLTEEILLIIAGALSAALLSSQQAKNAIGILLFAGALVLFFILVFRT